MPLIIIVIIYHLYWLSQLAGPVASGGGGSLFAPLAVYDMTTISGSTLTDISGNGRDGTLHGATTVAGGITCNASSDWIGIPGSLGNSNFTVIVVAKSNAGDSNYMWAEAKSGEGTPGTTSINLSAKSHQAIRDQSGNNIDVSVVPFTYDSAYFAYYFTRTSSTTATWGVINSGYSASGTGSGVSIASTDLGSLCAQDVGASRRNFWGGTIAYVAIYNRALNTAALNGVYEQLRVRLLPRGVLLSPLLGSLASGPVWQRQGEVITKTIAIDTSVLQEPRALYESGCQILSSPCFKMWYDSAGSGEVYAESADGLTWTKRTTVLNLPGGIQHIGIAHVGSTYYAYLPNAGLDCYTSSDGGITWALTLVHCLTYANGTNSPVNVHVFMDGAVCRLSAEAAGWGYGGGTYGWGMATSTDCLHWVWGPNNPVMKYGLNWSDVLSVSSPMIFKLGQTFWAWGHENGSGSNLARAVCAAWDGPCEFYPQVWTFQRGSTDEGGPGFAADSQVADQCPVEVSGLAACTALGASTCTYMFYDAFPDQQHATIKLAIAPMPMSQLITTNEGMTSTTP